MARASLNPCDRSWVRVRVWIPVISPMMASGLPLELLADVLAGVEADLVVVTGEEQSVRALVVKLSVQVDHRDPRCSGRLADAGQLVAVLREDDQRIRLLGDGRLNRSDLRRRVGRSLEHLELDVAVGRRLLLGEGVDGGEEAVVRHRAGERDPDVLAGGCAPARGGHGPGIRGGRGRLARWTYTP